MTVLIATDAWRPQINGAVRTPESFVEASCRIGVEIHLLTPEGFASVPLPIHRGLRCAVPARIPVPVAWGYHVLRRFHAAAAATMVASPSFAAELERRGFRRLKARSRGVDTELFHPDRVGALKRPRPIFLIFGRLAVDRPLMRLPA